MPAMEAAASTTWKTWAHYSLILAGQVGEGGPGDTGILGYCENLQMFFTKFNISQVFSNVRDS